jgi:hypothetical protein
MAGECRRDRVDGGGHYDAAVRMRALIPLALASALVLAACGGSDADRFEEKGAPFTFSYPTELQKVFADTGREVKGQDPVYRVALGTDETNVVVAATYDVGKDTAKIKPAKLAVAVERAARSLARAVDAEVPKRSDGTLGDMPAAIFEFAARKRGLTTRVYYAFQGRTQYFVRCQWDDAGATTIPAACDEVAETFAPAAAG